MQNSRVVIPIAGVGSLNWCGDKLVDWVRGGMRIHLDGTVENPRISWGFPFDAACATEDGKYAVIYQRVGTKALLLRDGQILRELNRSYYHAEVYEYPLCIWQDANGRTLIAHCPEAYNRIDIEEAESGRRLTETVRKPSDFFHSRLTVNPMGTRLLSAGWVWHPWNGVVYYDIVEALRNPTHLDSTKDQAPGALNVGAAEETFGCWQTEDRVLLSASDEQEDKQEEEVAKLGEPRLHPCGIAVYDVSTRRYVRSVVLNEPPGTLMPVGENHAVSFYKYPKLVSLETGEILAGWDDLDTGTQVSSIIWDKKLPPLAIDAKNRRFAVASATEIHVVQIGL